MWKLVKGIWQKERLSNVDVKVMKESESLLFTMLINNIFLFTFFMLIRFSQHIRCIFFLGKTSCCNNRRSFYWSVITLVDKHIALNGKLPLMETETCEKYLCVFLVARLRWLTNCGNINLGSQHKSYYKHALFIRCQNNVEYLIKV